MSLTQREIDILAQYGMKPSDFEPNEEILALKKFLKDTDYITAKALERILEGQPTGDLVSQYSDILAKRKEARDRINALEG